MPPLSDTAPGPGRVRAVGRTLLISAVYLLAWCGLDVVSLQFEVVPEVQVWYPPSALDVVLLLVCGLRFWPLLLLNTFVHVFLVTQRPLQPLAFVAFDSVTTIGYVAACALLLRLRINPRLPSLRDVAWFIAIAGLGAPLFIAAGQTLNFWLCGLITRDDVLTRLPEYWAGDATGVGMLAPALLLLLRRAPGLWHDQDAQRQRDAMPERHGDEVAFEQGEQGEAAIEGQNGAQRREEHPEDGAGVARVWGEALGQMALLGACIWIGYGMAESRHLDYRYAIFVPLIWIAVRHGFAGTAAALVLFNVAAASVVRGVLGPSNGLALQFGLMIVTYTGLLLGAFVSERNRISHHLRRGHERFALIAHATSDSLWEWDLRSGRVWRNCGMTTLFGYQADEIVPTIEWWHANIHPDDRERVKASIHAARQSQAQAWADEYRYLKRNGEAAYVLDKAHIVRDRSGRAIKMVGGIVDATAQREAEHRLRHSTSHDALTELPNRLLFLEFLQRAVDALARQNTAPPTAPAAPSSASDDALAVVPEGEGVPSLAVLLFDLDRFKVVNDSLGHAAGDDLLRHVAARLRRTVRPGDTAARFGSDEFAILLEGPGQVAEVASIVARVQAALREPVRLKTEGEGGRGDGSDEAVAKVAGQGAGEVEVSVAASVGIVVAQARGYSRAEDVLRDADIALHRAKEKAGGSYALFDRAMHARALRLLRLETDLRAVVEGGDIERHLSLCFQPIVRLGDGEVEGFEALLRWQHPELGAISPNEFVPVAEETGLIVPIGAWVLEQSCRQLRRWANIFPERAPLTVSVNLSGRQLAQPNLAGRFAQVLAEWEVEARWVRLEITESAIADSEAGVLAALLSLRVLGLELSVDDFGTGHSSLARLHTFPVSSLKIDRSFISPLDGPLDGSAEGGPHRSRLIIVSSIVALAHSMGHSVVAEGVETPEQLALLRQSGCEYAQGFWMARPLRASEADALLSSGQRW